MVEMSPSNFLSFGGPTVIIIMMNKFKKNESIMCKFFELMGDFLMWEDNDTLVQRMSEDSRFIHCIVQCMNQFPKNLDIQQYCFHLLNLITWNNSIGAKAVINSFKCNHFIIDSLSGLQSILLAMKEFPADLYIQGAGCSILWNIAYKEHRITMREHGAISILPGALETCEIDEANSTIQSLLETH